MSLVTLQEAREWLGIGGLDSTQDDARISGLILTADAMFEDYAGVALVRRNYMQRFDGHEPEWVFDHRPVTSVVSIEDPAGSTIPSTDYLLREEYGVLEFLRTPRDAQRADGTRDLWLVTYTAGHFAAEGDAPASIKTGMQLLLARWFHNPEPGVQARREGDSSVAYIPNPTARQVVPPEVDALWSRWRSRVIA